jgi:hypothetical protein
MKIPAGYCGLYCAECAIYLTCHAKRAELRISNRQPDPGASSTATLPKNIVCEGCHSDDASCYGKDCEIRRCARARMVTLCSECPDYVCEKLEAFYRDSFISHQRPQKNLEEIQAIGLSAWLEKKRQKS